MVRIVGQTEGSVSIPSNGIRTTLNYEILLALHDEIRMPQLPIDLHLLRRICARLGVQGHLAILTEPYLERVLNRVKTIESRFSKPQTVPFRQVKRGDVIFLKQSAGPVRAIALVSDVQFYGPLQRGEPEKIMEKYSEGLALDESFKEAKRESRFGTLIFLNEVLATQPFRIQKSDRRSWVVLDGEFQQSELL